MTHFCPNCWKEIPRTSECCPYCNADLTTLDGASFQEKLIRALRHPEPETRMRAVEILGELKSPEARTPLRELLKLADDPFLIGGIIKALAAIEKKSLIEEIELLLALDNFPLYFYKTAQKALRQLKQESKAKFHERG
jgi:HEAT repeat protein